MLTLEEVKEYIKNNLEIEVNCDRGYYEEVSISISIKLEGETVSTDYFNT